MHYLIIVSIIWGFSFGIIKTSFAGIPPEFLAFIRLSLASAVFLFFLKTNPLKNLQRTTELVLLGAIQYGFMYFCLFKSFQYLAAYEVALMTAFTPIFVVIFDNLLNRTQALSPWLAATLATLGVLVIKSDSDWPTRLPGIVLMQLANAAFALGQIYYKKLQSKYRFSNHKENYGIIFIGAALVVLIPSLLGGDLLGNITTLTINQWAALLYLGIIASGLCFFWWNIGATKTSTAALAVFNNLKVPIAIVISLLFFNENTDLVALFIGISILSLALYLSQRKILLK